MVKNEPRPKDWAKKPKDGPLESNGIYGPQAFLNQVFTKVKPKKFTLLQKEATPKPEPEKVSQSVKSVDDFVNELLTNNPTMSSSTFLNLLKAQGVKFTKEADSSTSMPALARGKESAISFRAVRFLEKGNAPQSVDVGSAKPKDRFLGFTKFRAIMLQEGLGNFGDAYFYTKDALNSAAPVFEGKKIYADHPSSLDEQIRPERSVRDVLGHFENVHVEEAEDGRSQMVGDVVILPDPSFAWARSLMAHAVEFQEKFPDKNFIGLSINAAGDADEKPLKEALAMDFPDSIMLKLQEAVEKGVESVKFVNKISEAVSCDLVTEAGAGGAPTAFIEQSKNKKVETLNKEGTPMGKKTVKENEKEIEAKDVEEKPEVEAVDAGADGEGAPHDDAAQDVELIKSMLKKAFGGEEDPSEEECGMAKEAVEAFGEMGHESEKAHELAMEFMKASKHMAAKQSEKAEAAKQEAFGKDEKPEAKDEKPEAKDEKPAVKESEEIIKLRGELSRYKEQDKKNALVAHVEKVCKESKLSNVVTADFKDLVKTAKSVEEINKAWKLFEAGRKSGPKTTTENILDGITLSVEKTGSFAECDASGLDFSDCKVY